MSAQNRIRALLTGLLTGSLLAGAWATPLGAQARAGAVIEVDGLRHFHLVVGQHYQVPHTRFAHYPRSLRYDEIPVVHFLAREARVSPEAVLALRERGWAWIDVALHLGINPSIFVGHLPRRQGPPYGNAHGYWRKRDARVLARLSDREIIDFVNLRFIADHYRRPVHEVIVLRDRGLSYADINLTFGRPGPTAARATPLAARGAARSPIARPVPRRTSVGTPVPTMKEPPGLARNRGGGPPPGRGRGRGGGR